MKQEEVKKFDSTKLTKAIEKSGKSIYVISKESEVPATTIYGWVYGNVMPNVGGFKKVAKVLGVKMDDLVK